jgi:hypothetical protein
MFPDASAGPNNFMNLVKIGIPSVVGGMVLFVGIFLVVRLYVGRKRAGGQDGDVDLEGDLEGERERGG